MSGPERVGKVDDEPGRGADADPPAWRRPRLYEWYFSATPYGRTIRLAEQRAVIAAVDALLRPGHRVLEVGAGTGHYTALLAARSREVVALDASPAMVGYLRDRIRREGLTTVTAEEGVVPRPYGRDAFDAVVAVGVLNYVPDLAAGLAWVYDRLAPGGFTVFTIPRAGPTGHLSRLTARLSRKLVFPASPEAVERAAADAGLELRALEGAGLRGRERTLVASAVRPA